MNAASRIAARRRQSGEFLRSRRERLTPTDVGLPNGFRRRTPGLRREEVALLAGVGATWYTWLEQGRDVRPSAEVLSALADALRLDAAERRHLYILNDRPPPEPRPSGPEERGRSAAAHARKPDRPARLCPRPPLGRAGLEPGGGAAVRRLWRSSRGTRATSCTSSLPTRRIASCLSTGDEVAETALAMFRADSARYAGDPISSASSRPCSASAPSSANYGRGRTSCARSAAISGSITPSPAG